MESTGSDLSQWLTAAEGRPLWSPAPAGRHKACPYEPQHNFRDALRCGCPTL